MAEQKDLYLAPWLAECWVHKLDALPVERKAGWWAVLTDAMMVSLMVDCWVVHLAALMVERTVD